MRSNSTNGCAREKRSRSLGDTLNCVRSRGNLHTGGAGQSFWFHVLSFAAHARSDFQWFSIRTPSSVAYTEPRRERLSYEVGASEDLLRDFYRLLVITRKTSINCFRSRRAWFPNLIAGMGANIQIRFGSQGCCSR